MQFLIGQRVVKVASDLLPGSLSQDFAPAGARGALKQVYRSGLPYLVAFDDNAVMDEWCGAEELVLESVYDRAAELAQADEIIGDGPRQYGDGFDHPVRTTPVHDTFYPDSELAHTLVNCPACRATSVQEVVNEIASELNEAMMNAPRPVTMFHGPDLCGDPGCKLCYPDTEMMHHCGDECCGMCNNQLPVKLSDSEYRKMLPVGTVITEYWPDAMKGAAAVAWVGNEKHNPGEHLHWSRDKSNDHEDCLARHRIDAKSGDGWVTEVLPDGRVYQVRHASAALWRAACLAQLDAESVGGQVVRRLK